MLGGINIKESKDKQEELFTNNMNIDISHLDSLHFYPAIIEDIDSSQMKINIFKTPERVLNIVVGDEFYGKILNQSRELYSFRCKYISQERDGMYTFYVMSLPYDVKKVQRREYYRLQIAMPVVVFLYDEKEKKYNFTEKILCNSNNISAGGLSIVTQDVRVKNASKLCVRVDLDDFTIVTYTEHKSCVTRELRKAKEYIIGLQFVGLEAKLQNKIMRFVNKKVIEMIKKGIR